MNTDVKEVVEPSPTIPLPETKAAPAETASAPPAEDKGSETPVASPATSASEPAKTPTKVVDDRGDELTLEEQDVMARLTGQKTDEKKTESASSVGATPIVEPVVDPKLPENEATEEVAGVKLPSSHELAGYKPETRKRIEQFTAKLRETVPAANEFISLVNRYQANGVTPEQFQAWQSLGADLRSPDPVARREATQALHSIALASGLQPPAPDYSNVVAKIAELEQNLEIDPTHAEALRTMLAPKAAAPKVAPVPVQQPQIQQVDPRELVSKAIAEQNFTRAQYDVQEALAEASANVPATEQDAFKADVMSEIARMEATMPPADLNNFLKWRSRTANAAKTVLSRRQARAPSPTTTPTTKSLRPTTPNQSQSDTPKIGTEEYEIGLLTGQIQIAR